MIKQQTCCFLGHRKIEKSEELENKLKLTIERLIEKNNVNTFLFGSKSQFNNLCHKVITDLKETYPDLKRIYVRAEYPYISENYEKYLLKSYEHSYYPEKILNSGKACYIKRNYEMIDSSNFCVIYYDESSIKSKKLKSGTQIAYNYAIKKGIEIINITK